MAMQNKHHIRQHYIPQFLLRNFCFDKNNSKVNYFDVEQKEISTQFIANVFMKKYFYAKKNDTSGTLIEESLAKYETEISRIFKKINSETDIFLTFDEDNKLRIFLSLLAFRSINTRDQFREGLTESSKVLYGVDQDNYDFNALWLDNVYSISQCRSIEDILKNPYISEPIKIFLIQEFKDFYMCVLERRGTVDFVISDCYPTVLRGESELPNGVLINLPIYYFYPISANRILILVTNNIKDISKSISYLNVSNTLKEPRGTVDKKLVFHINKLYEPEVEWINQMIIKNASVGVVIKDLDKRSSFIDV